MAEIEGGRHKPEGLKVRNFRRSDIQQVLEIEKRAFPKTAYSKRTLLAYGRALPDGFVVIETAEGIAGYIIFDPGGHVHSAAVRPECRRKGLGTRLFMYAMKQVGPDLWLEVRSRNTGAIEFYKKMGMKATGTIPGYYGDDDAVVMARSKPQ